MERNYVGLETKKVAHTEEGKVDVNEMAAQALDKVQTEFAANPSKLVTVETSFMDGDGKTIVLAASVAKARTPVHELVALLTEKGLSASASRAIRAELIPDERASVMATAIIWAEVLEECPELKEKFEAYLRVRAGQAAVNRAGGLRAV